MPFLYDADDGRQELSITDLDPTEVFSLQRGGVEIGRATLKEIDQPFFHCDFSPTPEFEAVRELFEEEIRLLEESEEDDEGNWDALLHEIMRPGLKLVFSDGHEIRAPLLHIDNRKMWFRY